MTFSEAGIILKFNLPVVIIASKQDIYGAGEYRIISISKSYATMDRDFIYSACLTKNEKCVYQLPLDDFRIAPEYKGMLDTKVQQLKTARLKQYIKHLIAAGHNETAIIQLIRPLIDQVKTETKEAERCKAR